MQSVSEPLETQPPWRSPKEMVRAWLKEKDMKQKDLADEIGVSPAYISQIVNGVEAPTEEMLRLISKVFKQEPGAVLKEVRLYHLWLNSPEGIDHVIRVQQLQLLQDFTLRGPRFLRPQEIIRASQARLISITKDGDPEEKESVVIGKIGRYCITCTNGGLRSELDVSKPSPVTIPVGGKAVVRTRERFSLGIYACLQFNGLVQNILDADIEGSCAAITCFETPDNLAITLRNRSPKPYVLDPNVAIATALVYFDPFSEKDDSVVQKIQSEPPIASA